MPLKSELRTKYKNLRGALKSKSELDEKIFKNLREFSLYKNAETVLCYYSLKDEISTLPIMRDVLLSSKRLALPKCTDSDGNMEFYVVDDMRCLKKGMYGIFEPDDKICRKLSRKEQGIIIVPGLAFDKNGYRIGYGKGYYDRYLQNSHLISVGLCYNSFIEELALRDKYDVAVNYIVTDTQIISCD